MIKNKKIALALALGSGCLFVSFIISMISSFLFPVHINGPIEGTVVFVFIVCGSYFVIDGVFRRLCGEHKSKFQDDPPRNPKTIEEIKEKSGVVY